VFNAPYEIQYILKMELIGCPETSLTNCQPSLCHIPEDRRPKIDSLCFDFDTRLGNRS
jgi:hypothetical protein